MASAVLKAGSLDRLILAYDASRNGTLVVLTTRLLPGSFRGRASTMPSMRVLPAVPGEILCRLGACRGTPRRPLGAFGSGLVTGGARTKVSAAFGAGVRRPVDIGGAVEALEDADQAGGGVDLASVDPVAGESRVGVVSVVPRVAKAEKC